MRSGTRRFLLISSAFFFLLTLVAPRRCWGQATAPDPHGTEPPRVVSQTEPPPPDAQTPKRKITASWQDSLILETDDGEYRFQFGALVRMDGRYAPYDPAIPVIDNLTMRSARMQIRGVLARRFEFRVQPDFASGGATLADAFMDFGPSDRLHLRAGRDKTPLGHEILEGDSNVIFMERGLPSSLLPSRDVGLQAHGALYGNRIGYALGLFNGVPDGTSSTTNADVNSAKDKVVHLVVTPFNGGEGTPLGGLGMALGASEGRQDGPLPSFKSAVQHTYFSYLAGAVADGDRVRWSPSIYYQHRNIGGYGEAAWSEQMVSRADVRESLSNQAWQVAGYVTVTGEEISDRMRPKHEFNAAEHAWGALQLAARYGRLSVDPNGFTHGLTDPTSSREVKNLTLGANWYLSTNIKAVLDFDRMVFIAGEAPSVGGHQHAVLFRFQLSY